MNLSKMKIVFLSCLAFFILACSKGKIDDFSEGEETSAVSFALKTDYTLDEVVFTRSVSVPTEEEFKVRIENTRAEVLKEWEYGNLPSLIKVVPGSYKLVGWFGSDTILPAFDRPYYYGETKITLKEGDVLDTIVPVKVAAAKVAITFDESFGYDYDDYFVDIKTVGDSLHFLKNEKREGYFKPGKLRMRFGLKPKGSDIYYQFYPEAIAHVKAKEFYKMTLKAQTKNGALSGIAIETDSSTIDIPVEVDLPPYFLPKKAPVVTFTADDMDAGNILTTEGVSKKAIVMITSAAGLTELKIKTTSDTLLARGWPAEFDLMKATAEQKSLLKANGLDWSEDIDKNDTIRAAVWVNFNHVIKLLNTAPGQTSISTFEILSKDRLNQNGNECLFGVKVAPPVFGFKGGAPIEGNVWAKKAEFNTVYTTDREGYIPTVQYKIPGGEWQNATEVNGDAGVGTVKILGLNSQSDYIFRAKLGNHVSQEYNFKTEVVSQVPNSDMENWSKEKIKSYRYYPWASGESDPWWNTNNLRTTSYQGTWSYGYNTFPAVSYVKDVHQGTYAAEIRTTGTMYGNTITICKDEAKQRGMLFIGDYSYNDENEVINYGRPFVSRPSELKFWYKYKPYNTDEFEAFIEVQHREGNTVTVLGQGKFVLNTSTEISSYTLGSTIIDYLRKDLKATHIYIRFHSTTKESPEVQKVKYDLQDGESGWNTFIGSILKIDDIELNYE